MSRPPPSSSFKRPPTGDEDTISRFRTGNEQRRSKRVIPAPGSKQKPIRFQSPEPARRNQPRRRSKSIDDTPGTMNTPVYVAPMRFRARTPLDEKIHNFPLWMSIHRDEYTMDEVKQIQERLRGERSQIPTPMFDIPGSIQPFGDSGIPVPLDKFGNPRIPRDPVQTRSFRPENRRARRRGIAYHNKHRARGVLTPYGLERTKREKLDAKMWLKAQEDDPTLLEFVNSLSDGQIPAFTNILEKERAFDDAADALYDEPLLTGEGTENKN